MNRQQRRQAKREARKADHNGNEGGRAMTDQELENMARELAAACDEYDAGRLSEDRYKAMLAFHGAALSDGDKARVLVRMRGIQGGCVVCVDGGGELIASNDEAEALGRRITDRMHS